MQRRGLVPLCSIRDVRMQPINKYIIYIGAHRHDGLSPRGRNREWPNGTKKGKRLPNGHTYSLPGTAVGAERSIRQEGHQRAINQTLKRGSQPVGCKKRKKYFASIKNVSTFAPLFEREKAVLFRPIETHGEVGEWLKPTVC